MLNESPELVTITNRNVTIIEPGDDMTAESDEKRYITWGGIGLEPDRVNVKRLTRK